MAHNDPRKVYPLDICEFAPEPRQYATGAARTLPREHVDAIAERALKSDEREALTFVERGLDRLKASPQSYPDDDRRCLLTLKTMFARPRLPDELDDEAATAMWQKCPVVVDDPLTVMRNLYAGLRHHLMQPKIKKVWFVTGGAGVTNQGDGLTLDAAVNLARAKAELGYTVTIRPHDVPAD